MHDPFSQCAPSSSPFEQVARDNLIKVAKALGATLGPGPVAQMTIGQEIFTIQVGGIIRRDGSFSCYRVPFQMPWPEYLANVMLLLHDDPALFDLWRTKPGYFYASTRYA